MAKDKIAIACQGGGSQNLIAHGEERGRLFLEQPESMRFDAGC
jgi:hypothetical protein